MLQGPSVQAQGSPHPPAHRPAAQHPWHPHHAGPGPDPPQATPPTSPPPVYSPLPPGRADLTSLQQGQRVVSIQMTRWGWRSGCRAGPQLTWHLDPPSEGSWERTRVVMEMVALLVRFTVLGTRRSALRGPAASRLLPALRSTEPEPAPTATRACQHLPLHSHLLCPSPGPLRGAKESERVPQAGPTHSSSPTQAHHSLGLEFHTEPSLTWPEPGWEAQDPGLSRCSLAPLLGRCSAPERPQRPARGPPAVLL